MPRRHLPPPAGTSAPADSTPLPRVAPSRATMLVAGDGSAAGTGFSLAGEVADLAARARGAFNVLDFGAVGDGVSHPASGKYGTLAACQADYPMALALTDQMDWLGIEKAKAAATARGGTVYAPAGRYLCNRIISPFPASGESEGTAVSLRGDGPAATHFVLTAEATATRNGAFFISVANRTTTTGSTGVWEDFSVVGPAGGVATWGVAQGYTSGIGWGARRKVNRVSVRGFYAGFAVCGDQTEISNLYVRDCTYGVYYDANNTVPLLGDMLWTRLIVDDCAIANVAVAHNSTIPKNVFAKCITAGAPYCFYKETNNGAPANGGLAHGCTFVNHQFETVGVSAFSDDRPWDTVVGARLARLTGPNEFVGCQFGNWEPSRLPAGAKPSAMFDLYAVDGEVVFQGINEPDLWLPGTKGMFSAYYVQRVVVRGDVDTLIANMRTPPMGAVGIWTGGITDNHFFDAWAWKGRLTWNNAKTWAPGDAIGGHPFGGADTLGTPADTPNGVVKYNPTGFGHAIIATEGTMPVRATGAVAAGKLVRTAAGNAVVAAADSADMASPIVGVAVSAGDATTPPRVALRPVPR